MADFDKAWAFTREAEGGYSFNQDDPGGETFAGISRVHHPDWGGWAEVDRIKQIFGRSSWTVEMWNRLSLTVAGFYRENYWGVLGELNSQYLATVLFDSGVNCGPGRAGRWLQRSLCAWGHEVAIDGVVGPQTMGKTKLFEETDPRWVDEFVESILVQRGAHYVECENPAFTRGWFTRLRGLRTKAHERG